VKVGPAPGPAREGIVLEAGRAEDEALELVLRDHAPAPDAGTFGPPRLPAGPRSDGDGRGPRYGVASSATGSWSPSWPSSA
jgi:hypothetical protein